MAKPVVLPSRTFGTRAAAKDHFRGLHNSKYAAGEVVSDPADDQLLRELVQQHPRAGEKIGPGIAEFFVNHTMSGDRERVRPEYTGIWIRDVEGHDRDFSYNTAIDRPTEQAIVKEALRYEVEDLRVAFREASFAGPVICPRSGVTMRSWDEAAVVYEAPTWSDLTLAFAVSVGGWDRLDTDSGDGDVKVGRTLRDRDMAERWRTYWRTNAAPIVVSKNSL